MTPYQHGIHDAHMGFRLKDNPYNKLTQLVAFEAWEDGWKNGMLSP